ncbi:MAG TPA: Fe-S cluster assembly protein SufD [Gemmatimonadales bacterium]
MTEAYRTAFAAQTEAATPRVGALRAEGIMRFTAQGFPPTRHEEWRFTPITPLTRGVFAPAGAPLVPLTRAQVSQFRFGHPEWPVLVFVNGRFAPELSTLAALPDGSVTGSLAEALARWPALVEPHLARQVGPDATPFTALNAAFIQDGAFIRIRAGAELQDPIQICFVTTEDAAGSMTHPRNLILVEPGARAAVIESYHGPSSTLLDPPRPPSTVYFTNAVTEVVLGENAWFEHVRIQRESGTAYHIAFSQVQQAEGSHYRSFTLAMGAAISRHNLHTRLNAPNTEALLYGLTIAQGEELVDNHTAIYHDQPDCRSWEVYKAILDDKSRAVFNGKVFVQPEAQKTDAKQTNRTLLLSDEARVDTKPQLEIFADDVKCTHGAAVGYLDELPLFYFRSRGVPEEQARRLLTYAFAAEVLDEVHVEPVRLELDRLVRERLGVTEKQEAGSREQGGGSS